jgi:hypothetical protein
MLTFPPLGRDLHSTDAASVALRRRGGTQRNAVPLPHCRLSPDGCRCHVAAGLCPRARAGGRKGGDSSTHRGRVGGSQPRARAHTGAIAGWRACACVRGCVSVHEGRHPFHESLGHHSLVTESTPSVPPRHACIRSKDNGHRSETSTSVVTTPQSDGPSMSAPRGTGRTVGAGECSAPAALTARRTNRKWRRARRPHLHPLSATGLAPPTSAPGQAEKRPRADCALVRIACRAEQRGKRIGRDALGTQRPWPRPRCVLH